MSTQNGVLINAGGTIVSVVHGWGSNAAPPAGQTFMPTDGNLEPGQPAIGVFIASVRAALDASDTTMFRVSEAVSLGTTTLIAADVVAWVSYRRALRALLSAETITAIPARPAYPAGT